MLKPQTQADFPLPSGNRPNLAAAFPRVDAIFREFAEQQHIPGLAYGIVVDGALAQAGAVGVQNVVDRTPVTPDSVFRIASMTKSFTAMSVIRLRDESKLRLDDPAALYVPELSALLYPTADSAPITVRDLLTMNAGFPQDDPWADRQLAAPESQLTAQLTGGISFSNPPGIKFEYSNLGYAILGRIVTNVSGLPYQTYIARNILQPLGMTSSTFDVSAAAPERLAMGYRREADAWIAEPPLADGAFGAMGGLFTTITDFARYMVFLLSAFPPRSDPESGPIRRSSAREMQQPWRQRNVGSSRQTPDLPALVQVDGYGYGLAPSLDSALGYSVAHGGGLPGYGTYYRLLPDCGVGIAAFGNLTYASPNPAIGKAYAALLETGQLKPRVLPPAPALLAVQAAITRLYEQWDEAAIRALATESFFQDMPLEKRRQQLEQLRASFGKCASTTAIAPENALRGRWTMRCRAGRIEVYTTLAPSVPPQVQVLEFTAIKALNPALKRCAAQLVRLVDQWDEDQASTLFARTLKRGLLRPQFEALRVQYGVLRLGDVLESDGQTQARIRLLGKRGMIDMKLALNPSTGKIREIAFLKPRETAFVP